MKLHFHQLEVQVFSLFVPIDLRLMITETLELRPKGFPKSHIQSPKYQSLCYNVLYLVKVQDLDKFLKQYKKHSVLQNAIFLPIRNQSFLNVRLVDQPNNYRF
jgi:hypothetical protein